MEGSDSEKKPEDMDKCPECEGRIVKEYDMGEKYCEECGYVPDESIFASGTGKHEYDGEGRPIYRPKSTYRRHDKGVSTTIGGRKGDYKDVKDKKTARRLSRLNWQTIVEKDRSFKDGLEKLDMYGSKIGLPSSIREEAAYYLWEARGTLTRGRSYDELIAGIFDILCKKRGIPRSIDMISKKCNCERRGAGKAVKALKKKIRELKSVNIPEAEDYLSWLCSELKLSIDTQNIARQLIKRDKEKGITRGRNPVVIAAGATYTSTKLNNEIRSQREVANASDVTEVSIRKIYSLYKDNLDLEEFI
ncbi:MAG: transcription initiation factor IIB family protein [Candidatus Aenigmatarchaeota archaeon]